MHNFPTIVVLDASESYSYFTETLNQPQLPTIDEDAILSLMVDALRHKPTAETELFCLKQNMINGECLSERCIAEDMDNEHYFSSEIQSLKTDLMVVADSVMRISYQLISDLKRFGLYENNFFNYEFERVVNNGTFILRRC